MQGFALPFLEREAPIGPLIQPAVVPLVGNTTSWPIIVSPDASPHVENINSFQGAVSAINQVINENVKTVSTP